MYDGPVTGPDGKVVLDKGGEVVRTIYSRKGRGSYGYRAQKVVYQPLSEFTSKTWTTFSRGCWSR
jgi:hypothetical protein